MKAMKGFDWFIDCGGFQMGRLGTTNNVHRKYIPEECDYLLYSFVSNGRRCSDKIHLSELKYKPKLTLPVVKTETHLGLCL